MSQEVFDQYSAYYDLLYRDKDYASEADYIARVIRETAPRASRLLEFGSGTGKHGRLLAGMGFHLHGVERSERMVAVARGAGKVHGAGTFECTQGDVRTAHIAGAFDAVISLFHVVSYQTSNDDLRATFRNASGHLQPGGIFFFDVWHGPAVLTQRPAVRHKRVEDSELRLSRIAEPTLDDTAGVVTVRYTMFAEDKRSGSISTFGETHHMRYLFPTEIDLLAAETGFTVERLEEFGTGQRPSSATWGVAYVLRKAVAK